MDRLIQDKVEKEMGNNVTGTSAELKFAFDVILKLLKNLAWVFYFLNFLNYRR